MLKKIVVAVFILLTVGSVFFYFNIKNSKKDILCEEPYQTQLEDLKKDNLVNIETFEKYSINDIYTGKISDLDLSDKKTNLFRTNLKSQVEELGVNFAGHYSIVNIGMTGWGNNYFIVDVITGKTYPFPYEATFIDFKKDSNLIIVNSKSAIENYMNNVSHPSERCVSTGAVGIYYTDLRPSYFIWENNDLIYIQSNNPFLLEDKFWEEY